MDVRLYDFIRSSAAYRVRIALALKGIDYESVPVDLLGGAQFAPAFRHLNPQSLVPALETGDGVITQSLAIIEYLEERYPRPALLPADRGDRGRARAMALVIAAEVHPIQNLRVLNHLRDALGQPPDAVKAWARHWIESGLAAFQALLGPASGRYVLGDAVMLPDILLAPQMGNARRFGCDLSGLTRLVEIDAALRTLPAFRDTAPPVQKA